MRLLSKIIFIQQNHTSVRRDIRKQKAQLQRGHCLKIILTSTDENLYIHAYKSSVTLQHSDIVHHSTQKNIDKFLMINNI